MNIRERAGLLLFIMGMSNFPSPDRLILYLLILMCISVGAFMFLYEK